MNVPVIHAKMAQHATTYWTNIHAHVLLDTKGQDVKLVGTHTVLFLDDFGSGEDSTISFDL